MVAVPHDALSWVSPSPTWGDLGDLSRPAIREEFLRPAILRFAHDGFMDELLSALAHHPQRLGEWRAQPETWDKPMRTPPTASLLALTEPVSTLSVQLARLGAARGPVRRALPAPAADGGDDATAVLKLFQPSQQRHYVITASLVCQRPGLPDRRLDAGKQERAGFVLRRILPANDQARPEDDARTWDEYAFVLGPKGPRWKPARDVDGRAARLLPGEERMSLFSLGFDESPERKRRVFGGVIPVGRRESFVAAAVEPGAVDGADGTAGAAATTPDVDPRRLMFQMQVTGPWSELVQQNLDENERNAGRSVQTAEIRNVFGNTAPTLRATDESVKRARDQAQTSSWYTLLDFERFLFRHVPRVHGVLAGTRPRSALDAQKEEPLLRRLERVVLDSSLRGQQASLLEVLTLLARDPSIGQKLEQVDVTYDSANPDSRWPAFRFPLADVLDEGPFPFVVDGADLTGRAGSSDATLGRVEQALSGLADLVEQALPSADAVPLPEIPVQARPQLDTRPAWFAIRCVYERPNCGPFEPPVVSEPTRPFQLAGFFDPEAPVRAVRIPLPADISPAGLRKFPKGTTLMISDMLCGQLKKIRKLTLGDLVLSVLPWPFHKDLPNPGATGVCRGGDGDSFGMFCSLSIPIVTLCALIILIILVLLFDIFFRWFPLLFFCFPIKLFSGKGR
jgi:hypothetical protein